VSGLGDVPSLFIEPSFSVLESAELLLSALDSGGAPATRAAAVDYAISELTRTEDEAAGRRQAALGFSGKEQRQAESALSLNDAAALAATDALMGQVLIAAAEATGEVAEPAGPEPLREAVRSARSGFTSLRPALGFKSAQESGFHSATVEEAVARFKKEANSALEEILTRSDEIVSGLLTKASEYKDKILEALGNASNLLEAGAGATGLIRRAWDRLRSALNFIRTITDAVPLPDLDAKLSRLLASLHPRNILEDVFRVAAVRAELENLTVKPSIQPAEIDPRTAEVAGMPGRFDSVAANIRSVTLIAAVAGSMAAAHVAGPLAPLMVPVAYALGIAALVLVGMEYAGCGHLQIVKGVGEIVRELQLAVVTAGSR